MCSVGCTGAELATRVQKFWKWQSSLSSASRLHDINSCDTHVVAQSLSYCPHAACLHLTGRLAILRTEHDLQLT